MLKGSRYHVTGADLVVGVLPHFPLLASASFLDRARERSSIASVRVLRTHMCTHVSNIMQCTRVLNAAAYARLICYNIHILIQYLLK